MVLGTHQTRLLQHFNLRIVGIHPHLMYVRMYPVLTHRLFWKSKIPTLSQGRLLGKEPASPGRNPKAALIPLLGVSNSHESPRLDSTTIKKTRGSFHLMQIILMIWNCPLVPSGQTRWVHKMLASLVLVTVLQETAACLPPEHRILV